MNAESCITMNVHKLLLGNGISENKYALCFLIKRQRPGVPQKTLKIIQPQYLINQNQFWSCGYYAFLHFI